ncbi:AAA family ATPase [Brevibacillus marinus]|uniref:AAA family ATPase n=1 Tax=Brevibacillus marinus TaxID=2496837 RepID=UPI000F846714|nr:AAA family ATPase [Brevibacillus marinus]
MINYRIKRIYIENFKLIDKLSRNLNWNGYDLIILDGPNGFGKTTIFDAIELTLTGKISRIRNDDQRKKYDDDLLRKRSDCDCIIKIEFENSEGHAFTLMKRGKTTNDQKYKPDDFSHYETFLLPRFNTDESEWEKIDQKRIDDLFGTKDLERYYKLFYYIQQEEKTSFLKFSPKDRIKVISELFDTKHEEQEKEILSELRTLLRNQITKINQDINKFKEQQVNLLSDIETFGEGQSDNPVFEPLLPHLKTPKPWDVERPIITNRTARDAMIEEVNLIADFVEHFEEFQKAFHNDQVEKVARHYQLLADTIVTGFHLDSFLEIKQLHEKEQRLRGVLENLNRSKILRNLKNIQFDELMSDIGYELNTEEIKAVVDRIVVEQRTAGELGKLVQELNSARNQLVEKYTQLTKEEIDIVSGHCPLCGYDWTSLDTLLKEIENKRLTFTAYYDSATHRIEELLDGLYKTHLQTLITWITEYLETPKNTVDTAFFNKLNSVNMEMVRGLIQWCSEQGLDILRYLHKERSIPENLEKHTEALAKDIRKMKLPVMDGYQEGTEIYQTFASLYRECFGNSKEHVQSLTKEKIQNKIKYLDYIYFTKQMDELNRVEQSLREAKNRHDNLSQREELLRTIISEYDTAIKQHWNRIMKDIEIPFYIYSGKIIQYHQKGLGIFIKESETGEAKSIQFVSNHLSGHDVINYFSTGQLSALIISFTLTLNKVYGSDCFGVILIDDPVQTMDEINMASLTELLRNEFSNKQIVLSTHEDDVSRYIRYKFQKYGKSTLQFNVKKDLHALMVNE